MDNESSNVIEKVELDSDEYDRLADAVGNHATNDGAGRAEEMDFEITDDESQPGDDGDSAVSGIKRRRTIRVVIRSRAFL